MSITLSGMGLNMTKIVNIHITVNAYWFPLVVDSRGPIMSIDIKSTGAFGYF